MSTALTQKILVEFGKTESYLRQLAETINDVAEIAEQNVQSVKRNTAYLVTAVEELAPESLTTAEQRYPELFADEQ